MAQPATTPKIEELRFRLKADPKNRLFYVLAEELRRISQFEEAERVLRSGLTYHATYLSAWVSLGRVLREQKKDRDAVESLSKAMVLDPGNVVAARLLADAYLELGEKVEAIKKYKLVQALLPPDEQLEAVIENLNRDLTPPAVAPLSEPPEEEAEQIGEADSAGLPDETAAAEVEAKEPPPPPQPASPFGSPWADDTGTRRVVKAALAAADVAAPLPDPSSVASLFEAPVPDLPVEREAEPVTPLEGGDAFFDRAAASLDPRPESAAAEPPMAGPDAADVFAPVDDGVAEPAAPGGSDLTDTLTMADLYARQGLVADARHVYENILQRDPDNHGVREKLEALGPAAAVRGGDPRIARLTAWLARVSRREVPHV